MDLMPTRLNTRMLVTLQTMRRELWEKIALKKYGKRFHELGAGDRRLISIRGLEYKSVKELEQELEEVKI